LKESILNTSKTGLQAAAAVLYKPGILVNQITCALLVIILIFFEKKLSQTVYQLKASLLANYLFQELKHPSHKRRFI
jgi:hypothetical protein